MATVGTGKYTYEFIENWAKLPPGETFGNTSAVATDSQDREDKNFKRHVRLAAPAVRPRRRPPLARSDGGVPSTQRLPAAVARSTAWHGHARSGRAEQEA